MREMKDSGVEWIGEIPTDWVVTKMNRVVGIITDYVASGSFADLAENVTYLDNPDYAMLIRIADLSGTKDKPVYIDKRAYDFLANSNLFGGEVILSNIGSVGSVYIYHKMYEYASLAPNSIMLNKSDDNRFIYYWFMNPMVNDELKRIGGNAVQTKFNKTQLRQFKIVLPPSEIQHCIANYLDEKCKKIDDIIAKQQEIIEKLAAYKQSIITETVTKGLHPHVEMKDSGIIWIGKIPSHWEILKLKTHTSMLTPMRDKPQDLSGEIPWIRIEDYVGKYICESKEGFGVSFETVKEMNLKIYPVGTILCTSSCDLGKCAIVSKELVSNQRFIGIIPDEKTLPDYLYYLMLSNTERLNHLSTGTIQANLSRVEFEHLMVQFPPYEEQKEISDFLDNKCSAIDNVVETKQKIIDGLISYKRSLI